MVWAAAGGFPIVAGAAQTPPPSPPPEFKDFAQRVHEYVKLRKQLQSSLPRRKTTKRRGEIVERQSAFAHKLQDARANARQGDVFTPEITVLFRQAIRSAFQGPSAPGIRKTIRQGEPVPNLHLRVNSAYPENLPLTTVPPTLLLGLPQLPPDVCYRIVGHDFILQDTEARVVLDLIPGSIP